MKYLIINGSPRKGNTWKLVEIAADKIRKEDADAEFKEIHLVREGLPFCCGCSNCFRLGYEKCPHFEKVNQIIKAMEDADGMIVASTTYNRRETSLLKNLFDHLSFMLHRPRFFTSKALVLTTTGGVGGKAAAKSISSFLSGIGFNRCLCFSAAAYSWNDYKPDQKTKEKLFEVAGKFQKDVASGKLRSPSVLNLLCYNLFRGMSLHYAEGSAYATQDGAHWTDEIRRKRVYDSAVRVPFYKKPIGQFFYLAGKSAGSKKLVTYRK